MGKGSGRRPAAVPEKQFAAEYDRIFGVKKIDTSAEGRNETKQPEKLTDLHMSDTVQP